MFIYFRYEFGDYGPEHSVTICLFISGTSSETLETLMGFMEKYILTRLYRSVFCPITTEDEVMDLTIQNRIRSLHWITTHMLDAQINDKDPTARALVEKAITGNMVYTVPKWSKWNILGDI